MGEEKYLIEEKHSAKQCMYVLPCCQELSSVWETFLFLMTVMEAYGRAAHPSSGLILISISD